MKTKFFLFFLAVIFISNLKAQQVASTAFDLLLKGLLSHSVPEISVNEAVKDSALIFIDAREKQEYEVSHIKNAIHVGYDSLDLDKLETLSKSQKLVVYCSVGYRSEKVSEKLKEKGFENVSNLYGGIFEWKNAGYAVVDSNNKPTEKVHAFNKVWGVWLKNGVKVY